MKTFTIQSDLFRAAQEFQAKRDIRYYLEGVWISQNGDICGTDGHCMFLSTIQFLDENGEECETCPLDQDYIISLQGKAPKGYQTVTFTILDDTPISKLIASFESPLMSAKPKKTKLIAGHLVDGKYPNVFRIVPSYDMNIAVNDRESTFCMQAHFMTKVSKVFEVKRGFDAVYVTAKDCDKAIVVEPYGGDWPKGTKVLIMPVRDGRADRD